MIIYKVTNLINGKCYIGKTIKELNERKYRHLYISKYINENNFFHSAIKKYVLKII